MRFFFSSSKSKQVSVPRLRLRNTLSGELEVFAPLSVREIKMYNCGPTVYDRQHIGNLRGPLLANLLRRTLEAWGFPVKHVSNITDVGHLTGDNAGDADTGVDRMEASAKKQKRSAQEIAKEYTDLFYEDLDALGIERNRITFTPATEYIGEQIAFVETLEQKGYAYRIQDGVYFDTSKFPSYGKLGHIDPRGLTEARVEENPEKRNPHDFALWKLTKLREKRQQEWESPWGKGFPGWHIECTAMIFTLLGRQIDIHIGGVDLIPIHHNNEIAQAEAATGKQFVRYWLHNEFITIEGKKVSKSLGNTIYLSQITDRALSPLALRYWYLTGHYRTPMNFTWEAIEGADQALTRLTRFYLELDPRKEDPDKEFLKQFYTALANDLDTPKAIALVWELIKNTALPPASKRASLLIADEILGLGFSQERTMTKLAVIPQSELPEEVQKLASEREEARKVKDFERSDALRQSVESLGYSIKDTSEGPKISKN